MNSKQIKNSDHQIDECEHLQFVFNLEAKILNFFGQRSSKEFVVESYFMRVSDTRGKTVLKVILNCTERINFIQY